MTPTGHAAGTSFHHPGCAVPALGATALRGSVTQLGLEPPEPRERQREREGVSWGGTVNP